MQVNRADDRELCSVRKIHASWKRYSCGQDMRCIAWEIYPASSACSHTKVWPIRSYGISSPHLAISRVCNVLETLLKLSHSFNFARAVCKPGSCTPYSPAASRTARSSTVRMAIRVHTSSSLALRLGHAATNPTRLISYPRAGLPRHLRTIS